MFARDQTLNGISFRSALMVRNHIDPSPPWISEFERDHNELMQSRVEFYYREDPTRLLARLMSSIDPTYQMTDVVNFVRDAIENPSIGQVFKNTFTLAFTSGFMAEADSTDGWAAPDVFETFATQERIRPVEPDVFDALTRGKTAREYQPKFQSENYRPFRFAKVCRLDEQDLIDGDVNALGKIPQEMGKSARRLRPDLVYSELLFNPEMSDGVTLFHADHGNVDTGAALDETTLAAGMARMQNQQENGVSLNIKPKYLLVPPALGKTARKLARDMKLDDPELDLTVRVEARLENGVSDPRAGYKLTHPGSATTWYLAASASQAASILFASREDKPRIEGYKADELGVWAYINQVKWDVTAAAIAWQGIYRAEA